jgi:hypothetical protein
VTRREMRQEQSYILSAMMPMRQVVELHKHVARMLDSACKNCPDETLCLEAWKDMQSLQRNTNAMLVEYMEKRYAELESLIIESEMSDPTEPI